MHRSDAHHAAFVFQAKALGDIDGVVVAVPNVDVLGGELFSHGVRMHVSNAEGEGGDAFIEAANVRVAKDAETRNRFECGKKCASQLKFVGMDGGHGLLESQTASAVALLTQLTRIFAAEFPAKPFKIFDRAEDARDAFVILRAGFKLAGQFIGRRAHFVGDKFFKQFALPIQNASMWTEVFILQDTNHKTLSALRFAWLLERQKSDPWKANVILGDGLL